MSTLGRRALLSGGLALPAAVAAAQGGPPVWRLRASFPIERIDEFLPAFQRFAASQPGLMMEALVRVDDAGLVSPDFNATVRPWQLRSDAALVDSATLAVGASRGMWLPLPEAWHEMARGSHPTLTRLMAPLAGQEGALLSAEPGGPFLVHRRDRAASLPRDPVALLDYARQNPGRFFYVRPAESGFSQLFLMALPHLLGDRDPSDAQTGWDKSWSWLAEISRHIGFYPSSDDAALDEFAMAGADLFPTSLAGFLKARLDGTLAEDTDVATLGGGLIVPRGMFLVMPRHVAAERRTAAEPLLRYLLGAQAQAQVFGRGLLPGEAGFGLDHAAPRTDAETAAWHLALPADRTEAIATMRLAPPLPALQYTFMLNRWEEQIGSRHNEPPQEILTSGTQPP
ncbi:extracellular solute-binding protein [Roseococcus sp. YIM B11640]|uniref:extracellular solute-binding protein n=1 Tax=Roseococcus sp. YIM B11640 TaxID=3133973 RepID=UPI003C7A891D